MELLYKDTLGKQIMRSAISIALYISEGYGRFHFAENKHFCYYNWGSAYETATAIRKAKNRNLISEVEYNLLQEKLSLFLKLMNSYIKLIGNQN
jgi:four helix bundle protein